MSTKVKLLTVQADFDAAIIAMKKTGVKYDNEVQLLLASAVFHAAAHGNTNAINAVATSVTAGTRKSAIGVWLNKHAPVMAQDDKEKAKTQPFKLSRDRMTALLGTDKPTLEQAENYAELIHGKHWTVEKPDQVVVEEWSLLDSIQKLITQARKMNDKHVKIVGIEALPGLEALCADCGQSVDPLAASK